MKEATPHGLQVAVTYGRRYRGLYESALLRELSVVKRSLTRKNGRH